MNRPTPSRSGSWPPCSLLAAALALALNACTPAAGPVPATDGGEFAVWTPHAPRRGITLPPKTPLTDADYVALDFIRPGAVVVFSAQLGDGDPLHWIGNDRRLQRWLAAHQDVMQVVRMWPVRGPDDPRRLALRIVALHHRFPWITWFQIANEPDIEWPPDRADWQTIGQWAEDVWWQVEWHRRHTPSAADIRLLFAPMAQGSPLDPEHLGYDTLRASVELYLDHDDGLAGHEYWDRGNVFLVEQRWPAWLQARLRSVPFFVTEAGRRPGQANGQPDALLGEELLTFASATQARTITPFVLSSPGGAFDQFDFVDRQGHLRAPLFVWSSRGP